MYRRWKEAELSSPSGQLWIRGMWVAPVAAPTWRRARERVKDGPCTPRIRSGVGGGRRCPLRCRFPRWESGPADLRRLSFLWLYGIMVNAPGGKLGRLLGVYIAGLLRGVAGGPASPRSDGPTMLIGGALIVAGGLVLSGWRNATSSPSVGSPKAFAALALSGGGSQEPQSSLARGRCAHALTKAACVPTTTLGASGPTRPAYTKPHATPSSIPTTCLVLATCGMMPTRRTQATGA